MASFLYLSHHLKELSVNITPRAFAQMYLRDMEDILHSWPTYQAVFDDICLRICRLSKVGALQALQVSWRSRCLPSFREALSEIYWKSLIWALGTIHNTYVLFFLSFFLTETLVYKQKKKNMFKPLRALSSFLHPSLPSSLLSPFLPLISPSWRTVDGYAPGMWIHGWSKLKWSLHGAKEKQNIPLWNMPHWHTDCFELKLLKKQLGQDRWSSLVPWKQEIHLPCEKYPVSTKRWRDVLITRDREFRTEKAV